MVQGDKHRRVRRMVMALCGRCKRSIEAGQRTVKGRGFEFPVHAGCKERHAFLLMVEAEGLVCEIGRVDAYSSAEMAAIYELAQSREPKCQLEVHVLDVDGVEKVTTAWRRP